MTMRDCQSPFFYFFFIFFSSCESCESCNLVNGFNIPGAPPPLSFLLLDHSAGLLHRIDWSISDWLETRQTHIKRPSNAIVHSSWLAPRRDWLSVCLFSLRFPSQRKTASIEWYTGTGRIASKAKDHDEWWRMALGMPSQFLTWQRYTAPDHYSRVGFGWCGLDSLTLFSLAWIRLGFRLVIPRELSGLCQWTYTCLSLALWSLLRNPKGRSALGGFPKS